MVDWCKTGAAKFGSGVAWSSWEFPMTHAIAPVCMSLGKISSHGREGGVGHSSGATCWLVGVGGEGEWSVVEVRGGSSWAEPMACRLQAVSLGTTLLERSVVSGCRTSRDVGTEMSMVEESSGGQLRGLEGSMMDWLSVGGGVCSRWAWSWSGPRLPCVM